MKVLDLFSGLGGASEAFVEAGDEVLRIESNPLLAGVPHTDIMTVRDLLDALHEYEVARMTDLDLIWASPPCLEFSQAYSAPMPTARREGREFTPDLTLMREALEAVRLLRPRWWVIENVRGACPWFRPDLGEHRQIVGPFVLWGEFPQIIMPEDWVHRKADHDDRHNPLRSNVRAKIPIEVSRALRAGIAAQTQVLDW